MRRSVTARCLALGLLFGALGLALPLASAAPVAGAEGAVAGLPQTKGWIEAKSAHFTVYSDAGDNKAQQMAVQLERFRLALGKISKGIVLDDRFPTSVFAFRNDASFAPYKLDDQGRPKNLAGYFIPGTFQNYVAVDSSAASSAMRNVYHEYVHQMLAKSAGTMPLWLNEGLAELFSTFKSDDKGTVVQVGHPIEHHVAFLAKNTMMPWTEVFATTPASPAYDEATRQGAFYAQSWLAAHYLAATDERLKALGIYLVLLREGADPEAAFARAFGTEPAKMAVAIDAYGKSMGKFIAIDVGQEAKDVAVTAREAPPAQILARLGDLLAQRAQVAAATRHLEAAKAAGWPAGETEATIGAAAIAALDPRAAEPHLRNAVAAGAATAAPYVQLGKLLVDRAWSKVWAAGGLPPEAAEARTLFAKAIEREPESVPALHGLATTYMFEGTTDPGLEAVAKARKLQPADMESVRLNACLLARGGKPAASAAVIKRSIAPHDAKVAADATDCLGRGAWTAAVERIKAKDHKEASRIVTEALTVVTDPSARTRLEALGKIAESGGDVILSDEAPDPKRATYNEAVDLTNAGKYDEAMALLATVLKDCTSGRVCDSARDLDAKLRKSAQHKDWVDRFNQSVDLAKAGKRTDSIVMLRILEQEVDEPELLAKVQDFLKKLGQKPAAAKPAAGG